LTMDHDRPISLPSHAHKANELQAKIDLHLITRVEEIEGHVPSNDEIALHARRTVFRTGKQQYTWRGVTILIVNPPTADNPAYTFTE
jgi:hypothetical protein